MGLTLTLEEAKRRTAYDLIQEAVQNHQPLVVTLENGTAVSIQQYETLSLLSEEKPLRLEPLPQFSVGVPEDWKDAIYDYA